MTKLPAGWSQDVDKALGDALERQDGPSRGKLAAETAKHTRKSGGGPLVTRAPVKPPKG